MKKILFFCLLLIMCGQVLLAQVPFQMNYQGVARDQSGIAMANQVLRIRITIRNGSALGAAEYSETRGIVTNKYGLFNFAIGSTGALYSTGLLSGVNWASGNKYMQVEMDAAGNNNFTDLGATQLLSVPYALYALRSGSDSSSLQADNGVEIQNSIVQLGNAVGDSVARFVSDREIPLNNNNLFLNQGRLGVNTNALNDGVLTVNSTDHFVPSLSFRSSVKSEAHTIMIHKASESGISGTGLDWSFNMQDYKDVQNDGVAHNNNTIYQFGWNISATGERSDATKPAFLHSFEQRYAIGDYGDCSEYHVVGVNRQGNSRRHWSVLSSHDKYDSYMYWTGNSYFWYADSSVQVSLMSLNRSGTLNLGGESARLDFSRSDANDGSAVVRQLNAAGEDYYGLLGLNNADELLVGSIQTPIWMQHGLLRLGGYNKTYGAIFNENDYEIHIGIPDNTQQGIHNSLQVNGNVMDVLKLKAWSVDKTWSHGIDGNGNYYIKDLTNDNQRLLIRSQGGMVIPRLTTTERNSIGDPLDGELIFNTNAVSPEGKTGMFEYYREDDGSWASFFGASANISNTDLSFTANRSISGNSNNLSFSGFGKLHYTANEFVVQAAKTVELTAVDSATMQAQRVSLASTDGIAFSDAKGKYRFDALPGETERQPNGYLAVDDSGYVFRAGGGIFKPIVKVQANVYTVKTDDYTIQLDNLTQTALLNLPEPSACRGRVLVLWNSNKSLIAKWKTNQPVFESFNKSSTVLPNEISLQIQSDGERWIKIN
ncbi:MAG: hypothetical protein WCF67_20000 [Chitinophagaceae bacterium]